MAADRLLKIHQVSVMVSKLSRGTAGSVRRDYAGIERTLDCRVKTLSAAERVVQLRTGYQVTHLIRFLGDPGLAKGTRLQWTPPGAAQATLLRVETPAVDTNGYGRVFHLTAQALAEDNPGVKAVS